MTIRQLGPGDEGAYTCVVENPYGEVSATLKVMIMQLSLLLLMLLLISLMATVVLRLINYNNNDI